MATAKYHLVSGALVVVAAFAAASVSAQTAPPRTKSPSTAHHATPARRSYDRALLRPSLLKTQAPETYEVKFATTRGDFSITVHRSWAPLGADRFYNLVRHHFYDDASLFRVVPGFVVQFGISAYPPVSAAWRKTEIKDDPVAQSNKRGYITFATSGPNTRTTQVFISLQDNGRLDSQGFAPFGVVEGNGMSVVDSFYGGYGDTSGPDQQWIEKQGQPYLEKGWPKLDKIKTVALVVAPGTPAAKSAPAKKPR